MSIHFESGLKAPPAVNSIRILACTLGLGQQLIRLEAARAGRYYAPFLKSADDIPFAKKPPARRERLIEKPTGILKEIQGRIHDRLLGPIKFPDHIFGGVRGKRAAEVVAAHLGADVITTLDIRTFFPQISNSQVFRVWRDLLGFSPGVSRLLTQLTTFNGHLPQGASTSCALANLVLLLYDNPIRGFCLRHDILYSTWIDDLIFSGRDNLQVIKIAIEALRKGGFSIPHRKLKIMPFNKRQQILGIVINRHPAVRTEYVSGIRSGIHKLSVGAVPPMEVQAYVAVLQGKIAYIRTVNPKQAKPLALNLLAALKGPLPRSNNY
jgi:hypothetical protein